ncbi:hypothetical protein L3Y34_003319 [Caenorhabditis briggsae]|uniref:Serpentine receptor class r-10 n=1 Tax=Caenorhabditis briggsae TaxID=6238 RepID=A0AAE9D336_CAEBR|nr:hypothetical protein L3Y34_003319 [Caenorhabditis briggsae]
MKISNELNLLLQCSSLFFAILFNSILIYLIITKSPKKMGNYKALMIYFSTFSMLFAVIDMIVRPFIHSHGNCFFMIMSTKDWPFSEDSAQIAISVLCGCGGVTPFLIAIHFIYRFFALERKGRLRYFSGKYLIFWFIIPVLGGVNWFHLSWFYYRRNEKTTEYIRQTVLDNFGLHMNETVYSAAFFYPPDGQGIPQLDWSIFISYIILSISMALPFSIMIIAGVMSHSKIKKLLEHGECDYTKRLQLQLYKALVVQKNRENGRKTKVGSKKPKFRKTLEEALLLYFQKGARKSQFSYGSVEFADFEKNVQSITCVRVTSKQQSTSSSAHRHRLRQKWTKREAPMPFQPTFLPVFLFFLPLGALFTAPLFHVDIGSWSYVTTYLYALYPAVDPLPIMFIVQEYRLAFYELFDCFRCTVPAAKVEDNSTMYRDSEAV